MGVGVRPVERMPDPTGPNPGTGRTVKAGRSPPSPAGPQDPSRQADGHRHRQPPPGRRHPPTAPKPPTHIRLGRRPSPLSRGPAAANTAHRKPARRDHLPGRRETPPPTETSALGRLTANTRTPRRRRRPECANASPPHAQRIETGQGRRSRLARGRHRGQHHVRAATRLRGSGVRSCQPPQNQNRSHDPHRKPAHSHRTSLHGPTERIRQPADTARASRQEPQRADPRRTAPEKDSHTAYLEDRQQPTHTKTLDY